MAEHDWEEEEVDQDEEEQLEQEDMENDQAFATPYHSHVGEVPDLSGDTVPPLHSMVSDTEVSEDHWAEENETDTSGMTRTPNSPVSRQSEFPSEPARLCSRSYHADYISDYDCGDESELGSFDSTRPSRQCRQLV